MRYHNFPDLTADPHDPQLSQLLATKVISKPGFASRERDFLQALSDHNISHPDILKSYAGFEYREITYYLSEKADTDLLRFMINAAVTGVDEPWLREQYRSLTGALAAIHGPTNELIAYHHDIKPSNILLFKPSNTLKLSD
jgi:serine/threonine protein kinase